MNANAGAAPVVDMLRSGVRWCVGAFVSDGYIFTSTVHPRYIHGTLDEMMVDDMMVDVITRALKKLYNEAVRSCDDPDYVLRDFQTRLRSIRDWSVRDVRRYVSERDLRSIHRRVAPDDTLIQVSSMFRAATLDAATRLYNRPDLFFEEVDAPTILTERRRQVVRGIVGQALREVQKDDLRKTGGGMEGDIEEGMEVGQTGNTGEGDIDGEIEDIEDIDGIVLGNTGEGEIDGDIDGEIDGDIDGEIEDIDGIVLGNTGEGDIDLGNTGEGDIDLGNTGEDIDLGNTGEDIENTGEGDGDIKGIELGNNMEVDVNDDIGLGKTEYGSRETGIENDDQ
ncbi:hypothetical protein CEUSTIGMA_g12216.t1 [Chlamydomonas eustigma]|uniref:Uncharacterized protein n=1 Tax=Chlamydomonas eustigma TaxID=1157962 RepID=A0A250XNY2_9CHLO|nr:hypothetical protein CEUSTIGMA_g12216.t1 [Chlamydomonas eustigma]|eukprot:GAX84795.1 hypothetical protein CEUSTIGMA_g12216.t1 [Chlamydomonas eustigma]